MNFDSPASHGFRMPPEWSRQEAIWLSWPHNPATWPGRMEQILQIFARFAAVISLYEKVCIIRGNARREAIQELLCDAGADISNVELFDFRTNDVWCRDHGPVFLRKDATGERAVADFSYNSWGGKFPPWNFDNDVPARIAEALHLRRFPIPIVCEGGALEINGLGDLLTTESVVLNTNRNPGISREEMTRILQEALGAETVFYLKRGMVGDDTDGHIDTLARFAADDVILAAVDDSPEGINKTVLDTNFRDLERSTIDAITLFGDKNTKNVVLEKSYAEYMEGFTDAATGEAKRGFMAVVSELEQRFPDPASIESEKEKKDFVKLFGEYLRAENILQNYDEFATLKALQQIDLSDPVAVEKFKEEHYVDDEKFAELQTIRLPAERKIQDYRSAYNDIRDWQRREKEAGKKEKLTTDWDDVVFEIDLLKSQEINLDYILGLIFEHNRQNKGKGEMTEEVKRLIRSSLGNRAKEGLVVDFIQQTNLDDLPDKASIIDAFFTFAQREQQREAEALIKEENLNEEAAKRYIRTSLKREYATENGTELNETLPKLSPLNPQYKTKKQTVFQKIVAFIEKFKGVGGQI